MRNFQRELEALMEKNAREGTAPSLLLHCCCAPCSSAVLESLSGHFRITAFFYNPNLYPAQEHAKRAAEQKRLIKTMFPGGEVSFLEEKPDADAFYTAVRGFEAQKEGGQRCFLCYRLRLFKTALRAKQEGFDYFATTLTLSPLKNAAKINEIGVFVQEQTGARYLASDFKKKDGYKRSVELSKRYGLYRQSYCGCVFSLSQKDTEKS